MANFSDITDLETFKVRTSNTAQTGVIYANGVQQVAVFVTVTALGTNSDGTQDYITLDSTDELQKAIKLVDYNTNQELERVSAGEVATRWGYSTVKGKYEQLPQNTSLSLSTNSAHENILTFYITCPANETIKTITVAASLTLSNNTTIDTSGTNVFDSHVTITANPAIVYTFGSGNLVNAENIVYFRTEHTEVTVWGRTNNVYLKTLNNQAMVMRDLVKKVIPPTGATNVGNLNIGVNDITHKCSIYLYENIRSIMYIYVDEIPGVVRLGSGGYTDRFNLNFAPHSFGFALSRRATYDKDRPEGYGHGQYEYVSYELSFTDQYGNPGSFIFTPASSGDKDGYYFDLISLKDSNK